MQMRELALGWLSLPDAGPLALIDAAAAAGFGSVGVRFAPPPGDAQPSLAAQPELLRQVGSALRSHGIDLSEMGSIWLNGPTPSDWCLPALEAGAELGASTVIAIATEPDEGRRLDHFSDLCSAAAGFGLRVAVEFFAYSAIKTIEDAHRTVVQSGQPNAGILVDALHLDRSGGSASALTAIPRELIFLAQLCDAPAARPTALAGLRFEGRCDRLDPGLGALPLGDFMRALPLGTPLELEVPCLADKGMPPRDRARQIARHTQQFLSQLAT